MSFLGRISPSESVWTPVGVAGGELVMDIIVPAALSASARLCLNAVSRRGVSPEVKVDKQEFLPVLFWFFATSLFRSAASASSVCLCVILLFLSILARNFPFFIAIVLVVATNLQCNFSKHAKPFCCCRCYCCVGRVIAVIVVVALLLVVAFATFSQFAFHVFLQQLRRLWLCCTNTGGKTATH